MRLATVLLVFLFWVLLCAASASGQSQPAHSSSDSPVKSGFVLHSGNLFFTTPDSSPDNQRLRGLLRPYSISSDEPLGKISFPTRFRVFPGPQVLLSGISRAVCYRMRTYVLEREEPDSDVTRVVGQSTCQPSSKFEMKEAVETLETSSPE